MKIHVREGIKGKGETARRCREYVMGVAKEYTGRKDEFHDAELDQLVDVMLLGRPGNISVDGRSDA